MSMIYSRGHNEGDSVGFTRVLDITATRDGRNDQILIGNEKISESDNCHH